MQQYIYELFFYCTEGDNPENRTRAVTHFEDDCELLEYIMGENKSKSFGHKTI